MGLTVEVLHVLKLQLGGHHLPEVWIFNDDDLAQNPKVVAIAKLLQATNIQVLAWQFMPRGEVFTMDKAPSLLGEPFRPFNRTAPKMPEITKWNLSDVIGMFPADGDGSD